MHFVVEFADADYCPMPEMQQRLAAWRCRCRPKDKVSQVPQAVQGPEVRRGTEGGQDNKAGKGDYLCGRDRQNLRLKTVDYNANCNRPVIYFIRPVVRRTAQFFPLSQQIMVFS